jgi:hypothetical protein
MTERPSVFISYRRQDTDGYAGWLQDRLADRFGASRVFTDVVGLSPGAEFPREIVRTIDSVHVFLALIGDRWNPPGKDPRGRLFEPEDWVRREIEAALRSEKEVVPILIGGVALPER